MLSYTPSKAYAEDRYHAQPVWAADGGAPDDFYELRQTLTSGTGAVDQDDGPIRGYLTAAPAPNEANAPAWPDTAAGITLDQVGEP